MALLQAIHSALLYSPKVNCSDDILLCLISGLFFNVGLCFLFRCFFSNLLFGHLLMSVTVTSLSSFFCCLLLQLRVLLRARLLSPMLSSWSRILYVWVCTPWLSLVFFLLPVVLFLLLLGFLRFLDTYFEFPEGGPSTWILGGFYVLDFQ